MEPTVLQNLDHYVVFRPTGVQVHDATQAIYAPDVLPVRTWALSGSNESTRQPCPRIYHSFRDARSLDCAGNLSCEGSMVSLIQRVAHAVFYDGLFYLRRVNCTWVRLVWLSQASPSYLSFSYSTVLRLNLSRF